MSTTTTIVPITAAEILPHWPAAVRQAARRDGVAIRAGAGNSIEAQSINTGEWMPILLKNGGTAFATAEDRDQILNQIIAP